MPGKVTLKFSKLDVARRQLETAIRLYFSMGDPVSIHTLVAAAYEVLRDLNRVHAGEPMLKDVMPNWVRPDAKEKARRKLSEAENFFKHADRDHAEVLEFKQELTELWLFDACRKYRQLSEELLPVLKVYEAWFWIGPGAGAGLRVNSEFEKNRGEIRRIYGNATRQSFFAQVLPLMSAADPPST
jgi:hypothetical protein